ncbi:MAG: MATE family efflux transporter [Peptostreptococcaceae bacterium]
MNNSISQKFTFTSLIKFTIPSISMLVFMSLYTIIDGVFVSRFVNTDALSSVNIVYPYVNVVFAVGIMLGCGSSAVIAKKLGENKPDEARENFTLIVLFGIAIGLLISLLGYIFRDGILNLLGASDNLYSYCIDYLMGCILFVPAFILSCIFQFLAITAGKPKVGLIATLVGGCSNILFDYLFIVVFKLGIMGAALATGLGVLIPSIIGIVYFSKKRSDLYFVKPKFDLSVIAKSCSNGSSEMVSNLASGVTTMLYNIIMMKYLGSDGVAAITIVLYGNFLINSTYLGFSSGVAPIISYNYGNKNEEELQKIVGYSIKFIALASISLFVIARIFTPAIVSVFADPGSSVNEIATKGFLLYSTSFLFNGINIFASAKFTAFSNGKVSAQISFIRTFIFTVLSILLLPKLIGVNGVWLATTTGEALTWFVSISYMLKYRHIYGYGKRKLSGEQI